MHKLQKKCKTSKCGQDVKNDNFPKSVALWNLSDSTKLIRFHFFALAISADWSLNRGLDLFESNNGDSERGSSNESATVMKEQFCWHKLIKIFFWSWLIFKVFQYC